MSRNLAGARCRRREAFCQFVRGTSAPGLLICTTLFASAKRFGKRAPASLVRCVVLVLKQVGEQSLQCVNGAHEFWENKKNSASFWRSEPVSKCSESSIKKIASHHHDLALGMWFGKDVGKTRNNESVAL